MLELTKVGHGTASNEGKLTHPAEDEINGRVLNDHGEFKFRMLYDASLHGCVFYSDALCIVPHENPDSLQSDYAYLHSAAKPGIPVVANAYVPELCNLLLSHLNLKRAGIESEPTLWISEKSIDGFKWPVEGTVSEKLHMISFASNKMEWTLDRIVTQAKHSGYFASVTGYKEADLKEFIDLHKDFFEKNPRMFGYGIWKPYIMKKSLESIPDGEFLLYLDAGSSINPTAFNRLNEYIQRCKESEWKNVNMRHENEMWGFHHECKWTKGDVIQHYNLNEEQQKSAQLFGGFWLVQKCDHVMKLVQLWLDATLDYHLWDDSPSSLENAPTFQEHRHCQSNLSAILKVHGTYTFPNEYDIQMGSWEYPFWATRIRNNINRSME
jgi:hypothetical protein